MRIREIDSLSPGDILVFTKFSRRTPKFKIGYELAFQSFNKLQPTSASTIYFNEIGSDKLLAFTPSICRFIETRQKVRDRKLNDILK